MLVAPCRFPPSVEDRRVWSIRQVYEDSGRKFIEGQGLLLSLIDEVRLGIHRNGLAGSLPQEDTDTTVRLLTEAIVFFEGMGARAAPDACARCRWAVSEHRHTYVTLLTSLEGVKGVYYDEISSWRVLILDANTAAIFDHGESDIFGQEVIDAFPSALKYMVEACKCLALHRWTASTYLCMGVVEVGIKALCRELNAQIDLDSYETTWDRMRKKIEAELLPYPDPNNNNQQAKARRKVSHPATWDEDEAYFFGLTDDIKAVSRAYRNTSMHFRVIFDSDEQQARRVISSTGGFMQDLSKRVRETP